MNAPATGTALARPVSLVQKFASKYSIDAEKLLPILKATAFKVKDGEASNEQMAALLVVADQYGLNPFCKEIFAFPDKQNGIVPVVGVDGWSRIINDHPQMDGVEFRQSEETVTLPDAQPCPTWMEAVIYRKDRSHPTVVREYLDEVYRALGTYSDGKKHKPGPWQTHTKRFLRHKVLIQGSRLAFGFGGIYDDDEAARIIDSTAHVINEPAGTQEQSSQEQQQTYPADKFAANLAGWRALIDAGKKTADDIIAMAESKHPLTEEQKTAIRTVEATGPDTPAAAVIITALRANAERATISEAEVCKHLGVEKLDGITLAQAEKASAFLANPMGEPSK